MRSKKEGIFMYKGITLLETLIVLFYFKLNVDVYIAQMAEKRSPIFSRKRATTALFFSYVISKRGQKIHQRFGLFWPIKIGRISVGVSLLK